MLRLREIERRDLPIINKWRNNPELIKWLCAPYRYIGIEIDEAWFENYLKSRGNTVRLAITEDDVTLGIISLVSIDAVNQSAELHIMIGDEIKLNKGIGTFAIKEMLNHAFYNLNLNRVELSVLQINERAIHTYEKIGFIREGVKREAKYKNGQFVDMYIYSILKRDYKKLIINKRPIYSVFYFLKKD